MDEAPFKRIVDDLRSESQQMASNFREAAASLHRGGGPGRGGAPAGGLTDPVRLKRLLVTLLKVLIVVELVSALLQGIEGGSWARFGIDLVVAGLLYVLWERILALVREQKLSARARVESAPQSTRLWDALVFSLLWSDEIYTDIPEDRRRLVVISYTLITLGLLAVFLNIGTGLMPLVIAGMLVLAAVNLVVWVVSLERGEKESLKTELRLARELQMSLIPKEVPATAGLDVAGMCVPAHEVGGDLYDYPALGSGGELFGVSIFDVSGKGMQAAMSALFTSGALASEVRQSGSPAEILTRLNRAVCAHARRGHFVAFLLAAIDPARKTLTFANAGQMRPLVYSRGEVRWLESAGVHFPLGMKNDITYEERVVELQAGDAVVLLTDGFTEAMNALQEMFGAERIEHLIREHGDRTASALLAGVADAVKRYVGDAPQHDDMTMVVTRIT